MSYTAEFPIGYIPNPDKFGALAGGDVYFGVPNGSPATVPGDQIQVYAARQGLSDLAIAQPVDIGPGGEWWYNGQPVQIKVLVPYCVQVMNSLGVQKYYAPAAGDEIAKFNAIDIEQAAQNVEINKCVQTVANYPAFASTTATIGQQVELICHTTVGDGGGGIFDVVSSFGLTANTGTIAINGAIAFKRVFTGKYRIAHFGAPTDLNDATTAINACVLATYKAKAVVISPTDEVYSVEIDFDGGKDYRVFGTILLPSGIILNGNGCRLVGAYPSAQTAFYDNALASAIETATYNSGTGQFETNRAAAVATSRVVGSGITNFTFINMNCAINAINMNEQCFISYCKFSDVSAVMRLTACFYLRVFQHIVRNSCKAIGQPAIHLIGGNHNAMSFQHVALGGPNIGIKINGPASFATTIKNCTCEEGKAEGSIGILFGSDAYCAGWDISNGYFEGVKYAIKFENGTALYGGKFSANIFNNNEYSFYAPDAENALRMAWIDASAIPDDTVGNRNLIDISATGNDVFFQLPSKSSDTSAGINGFLDNIEQSNMSTALMGSSWRRVSNGEAIGRSQPALANQNNLNILPFEGANIVTVANEVPFADYFVVALTTTMIDTNITFDSSNVLVFNFQLSDYNQTYDLHGTVYGDTVYRLDAETATVTITDNGGRVRVTFGNLVNSGGSAPANVLQGCIRHF